MWPSLSCRAITTQHEILGFQQPALIPVKAEQTVILQPLPPLHLAVYLTESSTFNIWSSILLTTLTLWRTPLLWRHKKNLLPFFHNQNFNCNSNVLLLSQVFLLEKTFSHCTCCNCRSQSPNFQVMSKLEKEELPLFWTGNETSLYPRIEKW